MADPPAQFKRSAAAIAELERTVLGAGGLVLRYGYFYGPGSAISADGSLGLEVARRRLPIVGGGRGVWSFIHVQDAARATVAGADARRARRLQHRRRRARAGARVDPRRSRVRWAQSPHGVSRRGWRARWPASTA